MYTQKTIDALVMAAPLVPIQNRSRLALSTQHQVREGADVQGTILDGQVHTISGGRIVVPSKNSVLMAYMEYTASVPVMKTGGRYQITVTFREVRQDGRQKFATVVIFDRDTEQTITASSSNPAVLEVLKGMPIGGCETFSSCGELLAPSSKKETVLVPYGPVQEVSVGQALADQQVRTAHHGLEESRQIAVGKLVVDQIVREVKRLHVHLSLRLVVGDSALIQYNVIGLPKRVVRNLMPFINKTRESLGLPLLLGRDLEGMEALTVRFPIGDNSSSMVMKVMLTDDDANCIFVNALLLHRMGGDCDGDTLMSAITRAMIQKLDYRPGSAPTVKVLGELPALFQAPVRKDGSAWDIRKLEPVLAKDPVQVALELMSKGLIGTFANGFNRLVIAVGCALPTMLEKIHFLEELGIPHSFRDVSSPKQFSTFMSALMKECQSPVMEATFDCRKQADARGTMETLGHIVSFFSKGTVLDSALVEQLANGDRVNCKLLNQIAGLLGSTPSQYLRHFPIASLGVGREVSPEQAMAVMRCLATEGVRQTLRYIDGSAIEQPVEVEESGAGGRPRKFLVDMEPVHRFTEDDIADWSTTVCRIINREFGDGMLREAGGIGRTVTFKVGGKYKINLQDFILQIEPSRHGEPFLSLTPVGGAKRFAPISVHHRNRNAAQMLGNGYTAAQSLPVRGFVAETILSKVVRIFRDAVQGYLETVTELEMFEVEHPAAATEERLGKALELLLQDYTFPALSPDQEVMIHDHELLVDPVDCGGDPLFRLDVMEYMLQTIQGGLVHPISGRMLSLNPAVTSKNASGTIAGIISPEGECAITLVGHLMGDRQGVNFPRLWRESRTISKAMRPRNRRQSMTNGNEYLMPDIMALANEFNMLVTEVTDVLGIMTEEGIKNSDKGLLTPRGLKALEAFSRAKHEVGLDENMMLGRAAGIIPGEHTLDEAISILVRHGYQVVESPAKRLTAIIDGRIELLIRQFTLIHPLSDETPSWLKIYLDGYKGIFFLVDQDFDVEVEPGRFVPVHAIMSGRTLDSKHMEGTLISGQLALLGHLDFNNCQPLFGEESLHQELVATRQQRGLDPTGNSPVYRVHDGKRTPWGQGIFMLCRGFILKQDPDDCSIKEDAFPATCEIVRQQGLDLNSLVRESVKSRMELTALSAMGIDVTPIVDDYFEHVHDGESMWDILSALGYDQDLELCPDSDH